MSEKFCYALVDYIKGGIYDKNHNNREKNLFSLSPPPPPSIQQVYTPELAIFQITDQLNASY